jgi:phytoene synthase
MAAMIAGRPSPEFEPLARHAGLAQGFTEMIAALPADAARRQLFIPLQLLASHGSSMDEVFAGAQTTAMRAALDHLIGEARGHLRSALALVADLPPELKSAFLPLALVRRDLKRMAAERDLLVPRANSRLRILWTLWRASRSRPFR